MKLEVVVEVSVEMILMLQLLLLFFELGGGRCYWSGGHILHFHD